MKIGIAGSNGFLGSYLNEVVLENGHELEKISFRTNHNNNILQIFKCNLKKIESCDVLINCCAVKNPKNKYDKFINAKLPKLIHNYIKKYKINCKLVHISTLNIFYQFLDDDYTAQKRMAEKYLNEKNILIIRPNLIWDSNGSGESLIFKKFLLFPLPFYFMINPGNLYRPLDPVSLAKFILMSTQNPKSPTELNVYGKKVISLFELFKNMASEMQKIVIPINPFLLLWIKFITLKKTGRLHTLIQQINSYDRTGDTLDIQNKVFLKFNFLNKVNNKIRCK